MFCKFKLLKSCVSQCFFLIFCLSSLSMIFAHESNEINEINQINQTGISPLIFLKSNNVSLNFSNNISNQRYILLQKHIDTTISLKPWQTNRFSNLIVFKTWFLNGFIKFFIISMAIALARQQQHQPQQQHD